MTKMIDIDWDSSTYTLQFQFSVAFFLLLLVVAGSLFFLNKNYSKSKLDIVEMDIELSGNPKAVFKIKRDYSTLQIANRIYIELVTRKVALPFEDGKDSILEIYNSWYVLFDLLREELKTIPGNHLVDKNASHTLIFLTIEILNKGLRPHLTTYQTAFRKWYELEQRKTDHNTLSPQELQMKYPQYNALVNDIKASKKLLTHYAEGLKKILSGN